jgi:hypothetical protein
MMGDSADFYKYVLSLQVQPACKRSKPQHNTAATLSSSSSSSYDVAASTSDLATAHCSTTTSSSVFTPLPPSPAAVVVVGATSSSSSNRKVLMIRDHQYHRHHVRLSCPFYCNVCDEMITSESELQHNFSILHVFNMRCEPECIVAYGVDSNNIGRKMLRDQGWLEHTGLGKDGRGIKAPLSTRLKRDRRGVGCIPLATKKVTHDTAEIEELIQKERSANNKTNDTNSIAAPYFVSTQEMLRRQLMDQKREECIRELIYTDNWMYIHNEIVSPNNHTHTCTCTYNSSC